MFFAAVITDDKKPFAFAAAHNVLDLFIRHEVTHITAIGILAYVFHESVHNQFDERPERLIKQLMSYDITIQDAHDWLDAHTHIYWELKPRDGACALFLGTVESHG